MYNEHDFSFILCCAGSRCDRGNDERTLTETKVKGKLMSVLLVMTLMSINLPQFTFLVRVENAFGKDDRDLTWNCDESVRALSIIGIKEMYDCSDD